VNTLTKRDWIEIYYALIDKQTHIDEGTQDPETKEGYCGDMESWSHHLGEIIDKIGPDGENMTKPGRLWVIVEGGLVQDVFTTGQEAPEITIIDHDTEGLDGEEYREYKTACAEFEVDTEAWSLMGELEKEVMTHDPS